MHDSTILSLVIPCYNEGGNVPLLLDRLARLAPQAPGLEFVVVDNGSTDGTGPLLARAARGQPGIRAARVERNQGYGYGILRGLDLATGIYAGWTHADLQTDPADALRALEWLKSRGLPESIFLKGQRYGRPLADRIFTAGMGIFESLLFQCPLRDINAQPTIFSRSLLSAWKDPPRDFALDLYAFVIARRLGYTVRRFPVLFAERLHGRSHWNASWLARCRFIRRTLDFSLRLRRSKQP